VRSLAFPAVGAGVYGWEARTVAQVAFEAVHAYTGRPVEGGVPRVELVEFVLFSEEIAEIFRTVLEETGGAVPA
jgi:O-acetyl-ADP-ribose deacetylase (regulator of RNase III)